MLSPNLLAETPLQTADAVAAIIVLEDGRFLLQARDDRPDIFYPGQWGLFGGATEDGETPEQALVRELREELGLDFVAGETDRFIRFDFGLERLGQGQFYRIIYVVPMPASWLEIVQLGEGREVRAFPPDEALLKLPLVPYDSFALWLYHCRNRFSPDDRLQRTGR